MHCAIKNAQFHSILSMVKNWCIHAYWDVVSYYRNDEQSITPTNFFGLLSLKLILNWFFKKSNCVSETYSIAFFFLFRSMHLLSLLFCTLMLQGWDRCLLILWTHTWIGEKRKMYESHVPIYDGGQKTHFFVFFFCFLAGAFHFFMTKSDPLRR